MKLWKIPRAVVIAVVLVVAIAALWFGGGFLWRWLLAMHGYH